MLDMSYAQEKVRLLSRGAAAEVLKERIRELESSQGRGALAGDYLKHVVLKYIEYCQKGDMKSQSGAKPRTSLQFNTYVLSACCAGRWCRCFVHC